MMTCKRTQIPVSVIAPAVPALVAGQTEGGAPVDAHAIQPF